MPLRYGAKAPSKQACSRVSSCRRKHTEEDHIDGLRAVETDASAVCCQAERMVQAERRAEEQGCTKLGGIQLPIAMNSCAWYRHFTANVSAAAGKQAAISCSTCW